MDIKKRGIYAVFFIFLIFLDRLTKTIFLNKHFSIINYAENKGIIFGLFFGNTFLIIISIIILVILAYFFLKEKFKKNIGLILVISGIFSNLIDRIFFKFTIDFIDLNFWPVFNLADVFIIIGIILLISNIISIRSK